MNGCDVMATSAIDGQTDIESEENGGLVADDRAATADNVEAGAVTNGDAGTGTEPAANPGPQKDGGNPAQVTRMGTQRIGHLVREFAVPSIVMFVVNGLYNIIDAIFMGFGVGPLGQATATIAVPIMIVGMAVSMLIGAGGNALMSIRLGEGKREDAEKVMGNAFTLIISLAVILSVLAIVFIDPLLQLCSVTPDTLDMCRVFVRIIAAGFIMQFFAGAFSNFIRTAGDPNRALYTMVSGTGVCIVLNAVLVLGLHVGVAGSAIATITGQSVSAIMIFYYFMFSKKAPFKLRLKWLRLKPKLVRDITALGSSSFLLQAANVVINVIVNSQLSGLGAGTPVGPDGALASIGVVNRIAMFTFFPVIGVAVGSSPLFGYNYGARKFDRVKRAYLVALLWTVVIGAIFFVLIRLIPGPIVGMFNLTGDLRDFAAGALQVQTFLIVVCGVQVVGSNLFQSTGQPLKSIFLSLTRKFLYLVPLVFLTPLFLPSLIPGTLPLDGVYWAFPIADFLSLITAGLMMMREFRRLTRLQKTGFSGSKKNSILSDDVDDTNDSASSAARGTANDDATGKVAGSVADDAANRDAANGAADSN
jgi:putative MATE family efflux protein